jgi:hypothetical protein
MKDQDLCGEDVKRVEDVTDVREELEVEVFYPEHFFSSNRDACVLICEIRWPTTRCY